MMRMGRAPDSWSGGRYFCVMGARMSRSYGVLIAFVFVVVTASVACGSSTPTSPTEQFATSTTYTVNGTWRGTFVMFAVTKEVTAALSESISEPGKINGTFTAIRTVRATGVSNSDGGSVEGTLGTGQTVKLNFLSYDYCDWEFTGTLSGQTMTGVWNSCGPSGSVTLTRS